MTQHRSNDTPPHPPSPSGQDERAPTRPPLDDTTDAGTTAPNAIDRVEEADLESFPASDPPPGPGTIG